MTKIPKEPILDLIGRFSDDGATLEQVMIGLPEPIPSRRTLQRWLNSLTKEGFLETIGVTKSRRYRLLKISSAKQTTATFEIPLSQEAKTIQAIISRPIQARKPVFYHREFLESYQPNFTYYLDIETRSKLCAMAKSEDGEYPAGTYARAIFHRLLIDLSWNSSRLEGNTYSLLETERLLEMGQAAKGKGTQETQMLLNHKAAIEFLIEQAPDVDINRFTILNLHALLSDHLLPDPAACGRLRSIPVGIAHSSYIPCAIPQVIEECFALILEKAKQIKDAIEQAFFLMVQLPYLQPFDDVNKRTSRLALNIPLIQNNLCPLSFIDVPEQTYINGLLGIYECNRIELMRDVFIWAYERSCNLYSNARKTVGAPDPFRLRYRKILKETVMEIVQSNLKKNEAIEHIRKKAVEIPASDQHRFIEITERELQSLHEGNISRYHLRLAEFETWKKGWK